MKEINLKACKSQNHDDYIAILLSKISAMLFTARSRNSIAVTSVDHFRNGNKRPISITSLSSTSSSSSGQSANHGLLNSLNLAFEALNAGSNTATDSPHFNRRSMNSSNGKRNLITLKHSYVLSVLGFEVVFPFGMILFWEKA